MTLDVQTLSNLDTHDIHEGISKHVVALLSGISKYHHEFIN